MASQIHKTMRMFTKDAVILREGQEATSELFYLKQGTLVAEINGHVVGTIESGQWFGEMAAILGTSRTATVRAVTPAEVLLFKGLDDANLMEAMARDGKLLQKLLETLANRIRETSKRVAEGQEGAGQKLEMYRKGLSGTLFALERLSERFKSKVMGEVADHLRGVSGVRVGEEKDCDPKYFQQGKTAVFGA